MKNVILYKNETQVTITSYYFLLQLHTKTLFICEYTHTPKHAATPLNKFQNRFNFKIIMKSSVVLLVCSKEH